MPVFSHRYIRIAQDWVTVSALPPGPSPAPQPGTGTGAGTSYTAREQEIFQLQADAPACAECGALMVRNGACYKCLNCGSTSGCS